VFAGLKRLVGLDKAFPNNTGADSEEKRPEWEREDGTIDKQKQDEALRQLQLHQAQMSKSKGKRL
jgi:hypothetical protein